MRIALVAGELSGDMLGAGLMAALRERFPQAHFQGIGGERMIAQGLESLFPLEKLSVMVLVEVVRRLPDLLRLRQILYRHYASTSPDVFIGIDAPEFNLPLENRLRARGVTTVHYVSPQVWAWRPGRIRKIARAVDLMLTLFPFEASFYEARRVPVCYVGHPLADEIPLHSDRRAARHDLAIPESARVIALLPGSRMNEVRLLGPLFIDTAGWLLQRAPDLMFIVPAATSRIQRFMIETLAGYGYNLPITIVEGASRQVMTAADVVLLASGTATLEAMLVKRPMVVAYKVAPLTAWIVKRLITVSRFALPNLLAGRDVVPEFIQRAATKEALGSAVLELLNNHEARTRQQAEFERLHKQLRCAANQQAAAAVAQLLAH